MDSRNLERLVAAYSGIASDPIMPAIYVIEPTNDCNVDCIMCPNRYYRSKGYMDFGLFRRIVDQIADSAGAVMLYFVGEPLLHRQLVDMIEYCRCNSEARLILSTNATILDEALSQALIASGLDDLILCIDGNTAQTYSRIRRRADFETVVRNAVRFLELKKGLPKPTCIVQLIRMHLNRAEIEAFRNRWSQYECEVLVTWLDTWANQFPGLCLLTDSLCPNRSKPRVACADLWFKMIVNWRGEVVICCHDWTPKIVLGDLNRETVREVWNGDAIRNPRRIHLIGQFERVDFCKECFEWSTLSEELEFFADFSERSSWEAS